VHPRLYVALSEIVHLAWRSPFHSNSLALMPCVGGWVFAVVQDKSVKRFMVRNMVETAAHRDLKDASVYESTCSLRRGVFVFALCFVGESDCLQRVWGCCLRRGRVGFPIPHPKRQSTCVCMSPCCPRIVVVVGEPDERSVPTPFRHP
jgi:hypothetical protein